MADEQPKTEKVFDVASRSLLIVLAIIAVVGAILRMRAREKVVLDSFDSTTLLYLGVAGALILLREVKSLAFGDYKVEFERIRELAKEAKTVAENAQSSALGVGKQEDLNERPVTVAGAEVITPEDSDDPWRNKFGGKSEGNDRQLAAEVKSISGSADLFSICLRVSSTLPKQHPLRGSVQFFLHPTFRNSRPIVSVGPNGIAELKLTAWGAFTVGVLADDGRTKLELNLAALEDAPELFRHR